MVTTAEPASFPAPSPLISVIIPVWNSERRIAMALEAIARQTAPRDLFEVIPSMTDRDAPVVRTTAAAIERVLGIEAGYVVSPGTYDQKHIDRIGKLKNCIAYGPGVLDLAHQPDEWIGVRDMLDSAQVMALVLADLLVTNPDSPARPGMA